MIIEKPRQVVFLPFLRPRQFLGGLPVYAERPEPVRIEPPRQKPAKTADGK